MHTLQSGIKAGADFLGPLGGLWLSGTVPKGPQLQEGCRKDLSLAIYTSRGASGIRTSKSTGDFARTRTHRFATLETRVSVV